MTDGTPPTAASRIEGRVERTALTEVSPQLLPPGVRLLLKRECDQVAGSFKARGAHHFLARLAEERGAIDGVITYSSGNHGRAVAEAAAARGIPALITVPSSIDQSKARAIDRAGAERVTAGNTSESRKERALEIAAERGWVVVPPFDHEWIIEGQSTVAEEILADCPELTDLWAPVGGGGLSAGCALALVTHAPHVRLHTVEPEGAAAYARSVAAGEHVTLPESGSMADGLLPLRIGARNWAGLRRARAQPHTVSEDQIARVLRIFHRELSVGAEPSGVVSSTPILAPTAADPVEPGVHVAIVSGGNIDDERLSRLLSKGGDS